jgi:hypothetical protein
MKSKKHITMSDKKVWLVTVAGRGLGVDIVEAGPGWLSRRRCGPTKHTG